MKAVRLAGQKKLELVEIEKPSSDGKNVIIKVAGCGICGSDLHYWEFGAGMNGAPGLIMGHEFSGTVEDPGSRSDLKSGDRVAGIPLNPCGECNPCKLGMVNLCTNALKRPVLGQNSPGAYAEYVSSRPDMIRKLPDTISDLDAAMIEPAAVCLHGVHKAGIKAGDKVLIAGSGTIGLLSAAWAKLSGASHIIMSEVNEARAAAAMNYGDADELIDAKDPKMISKIKKATEGGVDIAIDASASDSGINSAISALRPGGTLVLAGISLKPQTLATIALTGKELILKGTFGYLLEDFDTAIRVIAINKLNVGKYINRTIGLESVQEAFQSLHSGTSGDVKVVVKL